MKGVVAIETGCQRTCVPIVSGSPFLSRLPICLWPSITSIVHVELHVAVLFVACCSLEEQWEWNEGDDDISFWVQATSLLARAHVEWGRLGHLHASTIFSQIEQHLKALRYQISRKACPHSQTNFPRVSSDALRYLQRATARNALALVYFALGSLRHLDASTHLLWSNGD